MRPIRRIVDCGPAATSDAGPNGGVGSYQDYQYVDKQPGDPPTPDRWGPTPSIYGATGTTWVRLWADWSVFQPFSDVVLGAAYPEGSYAPGSPEARRLQAWRALQALDRQVNAVRSDGRRVLLTLWRCPNWANGTQWAADEAAAGRIWNEIEFHPEDRLRRPVFDQWKNSNLSDKTKRDNTIVQSRRELEYRWPDDLDTDSPWQRWFQFMYDRYRPGRLGAARCVNLLEVVNEPNGQMWPKCAAAPAGSDIWAYYAPNTGWATALMMQTAWIVASWFNYDLPLAGPALADDADDRGYPRMWTPYDAHQSQLLATAQSNGFVQPSKFVWTQHNYLDMQNQRTTTTDNASYLARRALRGKWTGYNEGLGPMLFISEGGYPVANGSSITDGETKQQQRIQQFGALLNSDDPVAGAIGMMSNYLLYSTSYSSGSSGLRRFPGTADPDDGRPRPAQSSWAAITPTDTPLSDWMSYTNLGGNTNYDPAASSLHPGHREVFTIDAPTGHLMHRWEDVGGGFAAWEDLGGYCTAAPAAYARPDARIDIAVRGYDSGIFVRYWSPSAGWSPPWEYIGMPAPAGVQAGVNGGPAIYSWGDGHRDVYVRGFDNQIYQRYFSGGAWSGGWGSLGAPPGGASSDPAVTAWASGRVDLFVRGADNQTWWKSYWNGWSGWSSLGGACASGPEVCSRKSGRLDLFVRGPGDAPWRRQFEGLTDGNGALLEGRWSPWERVLDGQGASASGGFGSSPAPTGQLGRLDMFIRTSGGAIYQNWWGH